MASAVLRVQACRPHCRGDNDCMHSACCPPSSAPLLVLPPVHSNLTHASSTFCSEHREQLSGAGGGEPCYQSFFEVCRWRAPVCLHMAPINFPSPSSPLGDNHSRAHVPSPLLIPVCSQRSRTLPRRRSSYPNACKNTTYVPFTLCRPCNQATSPGDTGATARAQSKHVQIQAV